MNSSLAPSLSPQQIVQLLGARTEALPYTRPVQWLLTDSRSLTAPRDSLFVALRTESGDGQRYVAELYEAGVRHFLLHEGSLEASAYPEANCYFVPDTLAALQRLAAAHRASLPALQLVAITGSYGKTIVKELLYQLLSPRYSCYRSPRSYNSQLGVALSLLGLRAEHELAFIEAGISQPGEMAALVAMIQPEVGVFTGLGSAHQEHFASMEEKLEEKLQLFASARCIIYPKDKGWVSARIEERYPAGRLRSWSYQDPKATLYIPHSLTHADRCELTCIYRQQAYELVLPFTDAAYIEDALTALCLVAELAPELLGEASLCSRLRPVSMRLEVKEGARGCTLINDYYSCDLQSLPIALDFLRRRADSSGMRRVLVLSDIEGSGLSDEELYGEVARYLRDYEVQELYLVGPRSSGEAKRFDFIPCSCYPDTETLLGSRVLEQLSGVCLLLKGARRFAFERLYRSLSAHVHQTVLDVDLSAVVSNLNHYRSLLPPGHPLICMIKADGYGVGAVELARTLQEHRVDYLAVAVADEGRELREGGISTHIMVMNPELSTADTLFEQRLEPEVYSFALLEGLARAAEAHGLSDYPIHIKVDSGMHRLGFSAEDIPALAARLAQLPALRVSSIFSHFAASDEGEAKRSFTEGQYRYLLGAAEDLSQRLGYRPRYHILNTAGIERYPEYALDMARLGLGLYGISPTQLPGTTPIARLSTVILQLRSLPAGECVGYGCRGLTQRPARIAVIPIGYADGFSRRLSNGAYAVSVHGVLCPTIGNVCMDACMIDVTEVPEVAEGDEVLIFGEEPRPIQALSAALDTIPYEVLTTLSPRIQRRYWRE